MYHPFLAEPPEFRSRMMLAAGVATAVIGAVGIYVGWDLRTPDGRAAGLALALAGDPLVAWSIVSDWTLPQRTLAQNLTVLDYTFLFCYATFLALACLWASSLWSKGGAMAKLGILLAWGAWAAAAFDAA